MQTAFRSEEQFTQAEFFDWLQGVPSSDVNHYELLGGRIVMTPPAGSAHARIGARICAALEHHASPRGLGAVYDSSAGYDLPTGETIEPDVSFVSAGKLVAGPRLDPARFLPLVPDLVVEILSPTTSRRDKTEKKGIYEKNRVAEYWLVDWRAKEVVLLRLAGDAYGAPVYVRSGSVESSVLPGLRISIEALFADVG